MANVAFDNAYVFKPGIGSYAGSDTRVDRSLPARLSDVVNVKDWGAVGNNVTDDTDAINAAMAYACTLGRPTHNVAGAIVFFPPGIYRVSKGGTVPLYGGISYLQGYAILTLVGAGRDVSIIRGNYNPGGQQEQENNGFLFQCEMGDPNAVPIPGFPTWTLYSNLGGMCDLTIHNESTGVTSGAVINMGSGNNRFFSNCHFIGVTGFACTERSFGLSVRDCLATCTRTITPASADAATRSPYYTPSKFLPPSGGVGQITGSVGFYMGEGFFYNNHATGFDIGFSLIGAASHMHGCSATQCGIGVTTGIRNGSRSGGGALDAAVKPADWYFLFSGQITSCKFDRCTWGIHAYNPTAVFAANRIMGTTGPNVSATISGMSWNSGTHVVTVTTVDDHNIAVGIVQINAPGWTVDTTDGYVQVMSKPSSKTFTYVGPASDPGNFTSGTWNYPLEYGVNCINAGGCLFAANSIDASVSIASFVAAGAANNNDNIVWCTRGNHGWILAYYQYNPFAAGNWEYQMCGGGANLTQPTAIRYPDIPNVYFLPGLQSNIPGNPTTGKERTLISGRATASSFGDVVSAFLVTTVDAAINTNVLTFASVPSFINNSSGFTVDEWYGHIGTGDNGRTVASTTGTTVTLGSGNLSSTVPAGSRIYFNRFAGTGTAYKLRYDGEAWRRIA